MINTAAVKMNAGNNLPFRHLKSVYVRPLMDRRMNTNLDVDPDRAIEIHRYFQALTDQLPQLVWVSRDGGDWAWASPSWTAMTGQTCQASKGHGWELAVHSDDRGRTELAWARADVTGVLDIEHRLLDPANPSDLRWFHTRATPLPELPGRTREWLGCCTDIHDRKILQDSVQNRMDQLLNMIHTVVRRTMQRDISTEAYAERIETRLNSIARTQALMNRSDGNVDMAILVSEALLAHAAHEGKQISIDGPRIVLRHAAVAIFGLALQELVTNAVEHGALSQAAGSISVTWRVDGQVLHFHWNETLPATLKGALLRTGFGKEMIETILKLELGAMGSLDVQSTGVRCAIAIPLSPHLIVSDLPAEDETSDEN